MVETEVLGRIRVVFRGRAVLTVIFEDLGDEGVRVKHRRDTSAPPDWIAGALLLAVEPLLEEELSVKAKSMFMAILAKKTKGPDTVLPF